MWGASAVAQQVYDQDAVEAAGSTGINDDDTIPQNTEGDQYMSLSITPKDSSNILVIDVVLHLESTSTSTLMAFLCQDTTANALASTRVRTPGANETIVLTFRHRMTAGTTSATTFKVRAGSTAGTVTFNRHDAGVGRHGGVLASTMTITELAI